MTEGPIAAGDVNLRRSFEALPAFPHVVRHPGKAAVWLLEAIVGIACLVTLLVLAATIPVLNLITLGYLMEVQGRVARTGRLRDALPLLPAASRLGVSLACIAVFLLPIRWLAEAASNANLIEPGSIWSWLWLTGLLIAALVVVLHLLLSLARGGKFVCFLRPIRNIRWFLARRREGDYWMHASCALHEFFAALRPAHHVHLTAFAYLGVLLWVGAPTVMFTAVADSSGTWQRVLTLAGAVCLVPPLMWLPFLQTRCAAEGRLSAMFELSAIRQMLAQAPFTATLATIALYGLAFLPSYYCAVWKALVPPHETTWDVMFVFLVAIYPAKVLLGWAYHRATVARPSWLAWYWINQCLVCAAACVYVLLLFLLQTTGQLGPRAVWQHHAFLLPFPLPQ
jgi:hypothetical protein